MFCTESIIKTEQLTRKFDATVAVDHVSLDVHRGEIYGLIGRNGAGKTTILKMVCGMIHPTSGTILYNGEPIAEALRAGRMTKVGSLIESPGLINSMNGHDNLRMKCICAGIPYDPSYIHDLLVLVGLADTEFKKAGHYSLGMRQRLGIALALVGEPELLVLDEPINGLDPQGIAEVREILLKLHQEREMTILISSHILEELSKLVTTCGIIDKGVLLRQFTREQMELECRNRVIVHTEVPQAAQNALAGIGINAMRIAGDRSLEVYERFDETPQMLEALTANGVPVRELYVDGQTLEEFFFGIVGGANHA